MKTAQRIVLLSLATFVCANVSLAETILKEDFAQQGKWQKKISGKGTIELVDGGVEGKCLKVNTSDRAMVYYSIPLDVERVRGKRIIVRAKVKLDNVEQGEQSFATAKLHVGAITNKEMKHFAQRFIGTKDWHDQVLTAEIPKDVDEVVLDLGIQNGNGTAWYDSLIVDDGVKEHTPLSIKPAANRSYREVGLDGIPTADIRLADADFSVMTPAENFGRTCIALRGAKRPDLPAKIETVIPVGLKGSRLLFLQAADGADASRQAPCLVYAIHYEDGKSVEATMREGVDIGPLENPQDLPGWKLAWTSNVGGKTIGLGVTEWRNPRPDAAIQFIRVSSPGTGAAPIIVAISLDPKVK